jgi:hypothetical protein
MSAYGRYSFRLLSVGVNRNNGFQSLPNPRGGSMA